jgi:hypothetical protein
MRGTVKKWTIRITATLFILFFALLVAVELMIGYGARKTCRMAQDLFPGDRVSALIAVVECESCDILDRNHAVWALGMLSDQRALPVLEKYYTGGPCDHSRRICQYELGKALNLLRNDNNYNAVLWRWMLPRETS